jgi:hypothetical protein
MAFALSSLWLSKVEAYHGANIASQKLGFSEFGLGFSAVLAAGWTPVFERGAAPSSVERSVSGVISATENGQRYAAMLHADRMVTEYPGAPSVCVDALGDVCGYVSLHRRLTP